MPDDTKAALRRRLLKARDQTSEDLLGIAAESVRNRLWGIDAYKDAGMVGAYYSIGSELPTHGMIQELFSRGRKVCLPKVAGENIEFREIAGHASLERGSFDIMEPKDRCPVVSLPDVIIVPAVGMSEDGTRLGYGRGFYDRYLRRNKTATIAITLEKQLVRGIPRSDLDQAIDWIVTEDGTYDTSQAALDRGG